MSHMVPITKKGYEEPIQYTASDLQAVYQRADATTEKTAAWDVKLRELDIKVQLLAEKAEHSGDLQKRLDIKRGEIDSAGTTLESNKPLLKEKDCINGRRETDLRAAPAVIGGGETVIHNFAEYITTGYTLSWVCTRPVIMIVSCSA